MELRAENILSAEDTGDPVRVEVPEWKGHLFVKVMSGAERDRWELAAEKSLKNRAGASIRALLVATCACDAQGKRIFTDNQAAQLGTKSSIALNRVFDVARQLNKLTDEDIEELEGNLPAVQAVSSGIG